MRNSCAWINHVHVIKEQFVQKSGNFGEIVPIGWTVIAGRSETAVCLLRKMISSTSSPVTSFHRKSRLSSSTMLLSWSNILACWFKKLLIPCQRVIYRPKSSTLFIVRWIKLDIRAWPERKARPATRPWRGGHWRGWWRRDPWSLLQWNSPSSWCQINSFNLEEPTAMLTNRLSDLSVPGRNGISIIFPLKFQIVHISPLTLKIIDFGSWTLSFRS